MAATLLSPSPEQADDDALMRRVAARDVQAFTVLAGRHGERPHRIAWRMLGGLRTSRRKRCCGCGIRLRSGVAADLEWRPG